MNLGQPNLVAFAKTLEKLAENDPTIMAVTSDSRGSGKLVKFGKEYPDQIVEVGIAEQNLVGMSAGLASTGKKVFAVSPSCFLTARSLSVIVLSPAGPESTFCEPLRTASSPQASTSSCSPPKEDTASTIERIP